MSISSAVRARRSVTRRSSSSGRQLVLAEHGLQLSLVVTAARVESFDHEDAGNEELSTGILPSAGRTGGHTPGGDGTATDLLPRLGVDDRYRRIEDRPFGQHGAVTHPGALGHH